MGKTKIEVICGFLESGKTMLIQTMLENDLMEQYDNIVMLQCEDGIEELRATPLRNKNVVQADITDEYKIQGRLFSKIKRELNPDLILIEYNGTWPISNLLRVRLPSNYYIDKILFCADATTFELFDTRWRAVLLIYNPAGFFASEDAKSLKDNDWVWITGKIKIEKYNGRQCRSAM